MFSNQTPFTLTRNNYNEEAYYSFSLIPLFGSDERCFAIYNPVFDNTSAIVSGKDAPSTHCVLLSWIKSLEVPRGDVREDSVQIYAL